MIYARNTSIKLYSIVDSSLFVSRMTLKRVAALTSIISPRLLVPCGPAGDRYDLINNGQSNFADQQFSKMKTKMFKINSFENVKPQFNHKLRSNSLPGIASGKIKTDNDDVLGSIFDGFLNPPSLTNTKSQEKLKCAPARQQIISDDYKYENNSNGIHSEPNQSPTVSRIPAREIKIVIPSKESLKDLM